MEEQQFIFEQPEIASTFDPNSRVVILMGDSSQTIKQIPDGMIKLRLLQN
jgi:hypothetical protein